MATKREAMIPRVTWQVLFGEQTGACKLGEMLQ
jgi:hypothetical protein